MFLLLTAAQTERKASRCRVCELKANTLRFELLLFRTAEEIFLLTTTQVIGYYKSTTILFCYASFFFFLFGEINPRIRIYLTEVLGRGKKSAFFFFLHCCG